MTREEKNQGLYVRMLGGFALYWNGRLLTGGTEEQDGSFSGLLQYFLHNGREGLTLERLEEFLPEKRDPGDNGPTLRDMIAALERGLREAGLPWAKYIEYREGALYWSSQVPMREDAAEFERTYREAENEKNPDKAQKKYLEACYRYTGEFLPSQGSCIWAAREALKYRSIFENCMEKASSMLKEGGEYSRLRELGLYAAGVQPLAEWEVVTMEALEGLGRYEEAWRLYEDTADYYLKEEGLKPPKEMLETLRHMKDQVGQPYLVLEDFLEKLRDSEKKLQVPGERTGGYLCSYSVFQEICRVTMRQLERGGQSAYLMLCTAQEEEHLERAVCRSVRAGDVVCRCGRGQCMVLMMNVTLENCEIVQGRIRREFAFVGRRMEPIRFRVTHLTGTEVG